MTASKQFASAGDFQRAVETIVQYKGEWYYGRNSQKAFHFDLFGLPDTRKRIHTDIHADDDALDLGAAKLYLFNHERRVYVPIRNSQRRYRYGTPPETLSYVQLPDLAPYKGDNLAYTQGFVDMLNDRYPSVQEAVDIVRKGDYQTTSVAVGRFFLIRKNSVGLLTLHFRDLGPILWLSPNGDVNMVEKTTASMYLTQCSKMLSRILGELRILKE